MALASSSKYFLNLFESGMRDAADATHALEGIRPKALEVLLAFIYEGKCQIDGLGGLGRARLRARHVAGHREHVAVTGSAARTACGSRVRVRVSDRL